MERSNIAERSSKLFPFSGIYSASKYLINLEDKKKILCPTLILWGKDSLVGKNFKPIEVWKDYCNNVEGFVIKGGHYLPEEAPKSVAKKILNFLN